MQKVLIEGGLIRKLWDGETDAYCDHLLRLDPERSMHRSIERHTVVRVLKERQRTDAGLISAVAVVRGAA